MDVGCFPFDMLYLSSKFLARGVTGSGGQVCFGLIHNLHLTLNLFGRSRRFDPDGEIKITSKIKSKTVCGLTLSGASATLRAR